MYPIKTHRGMVRAIMVFRFLRRVSLALRIFISMVRRRVNSSSLKLKGLAMKS